MNGTKDRARVGLMMWVSVVMLITGFIIVVISAYKTHYDFVIFKDLWYYPNISKYIRYGVSFLIFILLPYEKIYAWIVDYLKEVISRYDFMVTKRNFFYLFTIITVLFMFGVNWLVKFIINLSYEINVGLYDNILQPYIERYLPAILSFVLMAISVKLCSLRNSFIYTVLTAVTIYIMFFNYQGGYVNINPVAMLQLCITFVGWNVCCKIKSKETKIHYIMCSIAVVIIVMGFNIYNEITGEMGYFAPEFWSQEAGGSFRVEPNYGLRDIWSQNSFESVLERIQFYGGTYEGLMLIELINSQNIVYALMYYLGNILIFASIFLNYKFRSGVRSIKRNVLLVIMVYYIFSLVNVILQNFGWSVGYQIQVPLSTCLFENDIVMLAILIRLMIPYKYKKKEKEYFPDYKLKLTLVRTPKFFTKRRGE